MTTARAMVSIRAVSKRYDEAGDDTLALDAVSLDIFEAQFVSLMGPSGSGKTTLLNLIAGLDSPTTGEVVVDGLVVGKLGDTALARFRRRTVAVVFQFFNLLPTLTARENVSVPLRADGVRRREIDERVARALEAVGMSHRLDHYPGQLSGGEMQRVAIARALVTEPRVVLADEPTGNLDSVRGEEILELLKAASERDGCTVVMVTHDVRAAAYGDRLVTLRDGRVTGEAVGPRLQEKVVPLTRG